MANSLRDVRRLMEVAADDDNRESVRDLPFKDMAHGLGYVIALEELVRPEQQRTLVN
jgi:hypothetical protein